ncbi:MAG TPA: hypothetical protein PLA61_06645 [Ferruginibacter sp.]|mgnify:FL=1|nr:hypothetical protein [Chitinophagales bacterium]HNF01299.1 hypothetical protein [Ferruginibacter sp.]HNN70333.1 hypothetical protein [Ferruginibacter sp.]HQR00502.1 hypothetical protein [Ferruginibacter sp.]
MYEHKKQPLAPRHIYFQRLRNNFFFSLVIMLSWLLVGVIGYKITIPSFDWYDCFLNASMILSGMGPVFDNDTILSDSAKVFAGIYALISGVVFITTISIVLSPVVHRFFHKLHLEEK